MKANVKYVLAALAEGKAVKMRVRRKGDSAQFDTQLSQRCVGLMGISEAEALGYVKASKSFTGRAVIYDYVLTAAGQEMIDRGLSTGVKEERDGK